MVGEGSRKGLPLLFRPTSGVGPCREASIEKAGGPRGVSPQPVLRVGGREESCQRADVMGGGAGRASVGAGGCRALVWGL